MDQQDQIFKIYPNKLKLLVYFLGSLLFVALSLFIIQAPGSAAKGWPALAAGWAGIIFFGLAGLFFLLRLRQKKPLLLIDENGLTECFSGRGRRTDWAEVSGFAEVSAAREKFIAVFVHDPERRLEQASNRYARWALNWNIDKFGTPVLIPIGALKISPGALLGLLYGSWLEYRERAGAVDS